jgi:hypothetical protein
MRWMLYRISLGIAGDGDNVTLQRLERLIQHADRLLAKQQVVTRSKNKRL